MVLELNKAQSAVRAGLVTDLRAKGEALNNAIRALNSTMEPLIEALEEAETAYNESLEQAREFVGEIANDARDDFEERSERWQNSDKGIKADEFIKAWEEVDFEDRELDIPEQLPEEDASEHAVMLEELPTGPGTA